MITVAEPGVTVTEPTGTAMTAIEVLPVFPSLVAVISVDPTPVAVSTPDDETVATAGFTVLQMTTRPVRILLLASNVVAVACVVWPT